MAATLGALITYSTTDPTVTPTAGQSSVVQNVTTGELWYYNVYASAWENFTVSGGSSCPTTSFTKAAFDALVSSNSLTAGCRYTINDFSQGSLGTASLTMTATSVNTISRNVDVQSTFYPYPWKGVYDYANNLLITLEDHQGNIVIDTNGVSISTFDWGNGNYTNNLIVNSTFITTPGLPIIVNAVTLMNTSILDVSNMVGGVLNNVIITNESTVNLSDAHMTLTGSTITNKSTLLYNKNTGKSIIENSQFDHSSIDVTTSILEFNIYGSTISEETNITVLNLNSDPLTITNSKFSRSTLTKSGSATGRIDIIDCTLQSEVYINHDSKGPITISDSVLSSLVTVSQSSNQNLYMDRCSVYNGSAIRCNKERGMTIVDVTLSNNAFIESNGVGGMEDSISKVTLLNGGHIWFNTTASIAPNTIANITIDGENAYISISGSTYGQIFRDSYIDNSVVNLVDVTGASTFTHLNLQSNSTFSLTNVAVRRDFYYIELSCASNLSMFNSVVPGTVSVLNVTNGSNINFLSNTDTVDHVEVSNTTATFDAKATSRVVIKNSSSFSDGGFDCVDVTYISPVSFTCTANNSSRATYLGITSSLPVI